MNEISSRSDDARPSAAERDAAVTRIQSAFAEGRLDERELDRRLRAALNAVRSGDLRHLVEDLPVVGPVPARESIRAYGSRVERAGRWIVPARLNPTIFKGHLLLDLTAARLGAGETVVRLKSYKSTVEIVVPPGVEVDSRGFAYKGSWTSERPAGGAGPGGPVLCLRGISYKSRVIVRRQPGPS